MGRARWNRSPFQSMDLCLWKQLDRDKIDSNYEGEIKRPPQYVRGYQVSCTQLFSMWYLLSNLALHSLLSFFCHVSGVTILTKWSVVRSMKSVQSMRPCDAKTTTVIDQNVMALSSWASSSVSKFSDKKKSRDATRWEYIQIRFFVSLAFVSFRSYDRHPADHGRFVHLSTRMLGHIWLSPESSRLWSRILQTNWTQRGSPHLNESSTVSPTFFISSEEKNTFFLPKH